MLRGWPPTPAELPNIKNSAAYRKQLQTLPDCRSAASSPAADTTAPASPAPP